MLLPAAATLLCAALLAQDPAPAPRPAADGQAPKVLALGDALPKDLTLRDLAGKAHKLGDLRGKIVVLHFWSATCPWEVVAEPKINALATDYEKKGVVVLGVAANAGEIGEAPDAKAFADQDEAARPYPKLRKKVAEVGVNHAILADHGAVLGKLLDGRTTPHLYVFDKEGVLRYTGALDDDGKGKSPERAANYVRNAVDALLDGKPVEVASTQPYG